MPARVKPVKRRSKAELLSATEMLFIRHLLASRLFSPTEAARKAGYSEKMAWKLMRKPAIVEAIGKAIQERLYECDVRAEQVLRELAYIGFFNPKSLLDENGVVIALKDMPDEVAKAIRSMKISYEEVEKEDGTTATIRDVDIQFWDKIEALDLLTKHLGMQAPIKHQVEHSLDWDSLFKPPESDPYASIEQEIVDVESKAIGPPEPSGNGNGRAIESS